MGGNTAVAPVTSLDAFAMALLSELPGASDGGPYTSPLGGSVTLNGVGADPEGGAVNFDWDTNEDLLCETAGQNPTVSVASLAAGPPPGRHLL